MYHTRALPQQGLQHLLGLLGCVAPGEQIQPADGVLHASDAADDRQPVAVVGLADGLLHLSEGNPGVREELAGGTLLETLQARQQGTHRLRSEARHLAQSALAGCLLELVERRDAQLLIDCPRAPRPESGHLQQGRQGDWKVASHFVVGLHATGGQIFDDLGFERAADAGQLSQAALLEQRIQALGCTGDAAGGGAIRVVAIRRLAFDLEDVADLRQQTRDFRVGAGRGA